MKDTNRVQFIMSDKDIKICIILLLNFMVVSDFEVDKLQNFNVPSNENMTTKLLEFGYDMCTFVEYLAGDEKLWNESPREFFRDHDKCLKFLIEKLNLYK